MKNKLWAFRYWLFKKWLLAFNKESVIIFKNGRYAIDILKLNKMGNFAIKFIKPPHFTKIIIK